MRAINSLGLDGRDRQIVNAACRATPSTLQPIHVQLSQSGNLAVDLIMNHMKVAKLTLDGSTLIG